MHGHVIHTQGIQGIVCLLFMTLNILVISGDTIVYRGGESYTSDVNLERFYLMEENAMSNADVLVRKDYFRKEDGEETEEEHAQHALNYTEMEGLLSKAKQLHREVGPDLWNYLGHPINVFHIFRRLNVEWKKGLQLLLNSTPCKQWKIRALRSYLNFLRNNAPGLEDTKKVVKHMTKLQKIMGNPTREVANGMIGNIKALEPLTLEEQFEIGKILYDQDDTSTALTWLELLADWLKKATAQEKSEVSFKENDILKMMSTGYYLVGKIDEAVKVTEQLLDLDRSDKRVLENLNFFLMKQMEQKARGDNKRKQVLGDAGLRSKFDRMCAGQLFKPSLKHCLFEPIYGPTSWYVHKKEVLRHQPAIAIYHDVIGNFAMEQLKDYAHSKLATKAWISPSVFITPKMGIEIDFPKLPKKKSIMYSAQKMGFAFNGFPTIPDRSHLIGWGTMQILNAGRAGLKFSRYEYELQLKHYASEEKVGAMFAFLSEPKQGGQVAMKPWHVFSSVPKGSILVYYSSQSKLHSLCPALGGSQWGYVQSCTYSSSLLGSRNLYEESVKRGMRKTRKRLRK